MAHRGSCLCGSIGYEIEALPRSAYNCHCSRCRKAHGAAFATFAVLGRDQFRWTRGQDLLSRYESSPGAVRLFCSRCGSPLGGEEASSPDDVWISLGTLEDDAGARPTKHIFAASRAPWIEITDELPQFVEFAPD